MRRILVVDDDQHICLAIRAWLGAYGFRVSIADGGATRCLRKPFKPTTLLGVIDQCPSEAESRRIHFSGAAAAAGALSRTRRKARSSSETGKEAVAG